ncbi:tRNA 2'-phosphotransferase 1-like [Populus alba x Populus x berolinensis]|nr:tRNA 2'-phosphotransferase 1-like [Populus alba x Populus x berolinensis]KAJ6884486.1 tRNA 2'-phosphotransferase 1-like [Populus alba x Populus x berolinensis]
MRSDGFVKVEDLLKLNMKTFANVPLRSHTDDDVKETVKSKAIFSPEEITVCVHGTPKKNLDSILEYGLKRMQILHVHFSSGLPTGVEVISGMRWDVDVLIFLDVRKALEEGMKLYISDNRVI